MALVLADRVRDTTTTTGTGTVTLSGTAPTGYQTFGAAIGNGNTTYYTINAGSQWEVGLGTYSSTGPTLARTTVLASSNGGSLVDFSTGTKDVFVTYPAEEAVYQDGSAIKAGTAILGVTNGGTGTNTTFTAGSVVFAGASGVYSQDNANLFWDNSNDRLGISTTSPGSKLDVRGVITGGDGTIQTVISYLASAGVTGTLTNHPYVFYANNAERARIDTSGNFGIGTVSPASKLEVTGDITQTWAASMDRFVGSKFSTTYELGLHFLEATRETRIVSKAADSSGLVSIYTGVTPTERMRIDSSGNVGIGTSSPSSRLTITGGTTEIRDGNYLMLRPSGNAWDMRLQATGTQLDILSGGALGSPIMSLVNGGNVGIGTSSPANLLEVRGAVTTTFSPNVYNTVLTGTSSATSGNAGCGISFRGYTTGSSTISDVAFVSGIKENTTDGNYAGALIFGTRTNGSGGGSFERMRIDSSGNMLLGTTTTKNRLTVSAGANTNSPTLGSAGGIAYFSNTDPAYGLNIGTSAADGHTWLQAQRTDGTATAYNLTLNEAGGNVMVGTTTSFGKFGVYGTAGFNADANATISGSGSYKFRGAAAGTTITTYDYLNYTAMQFIRDNGNPTNTVGSITCTDTATTYNTSSDRRLKKDIASAADAGPVIDAIEIVSHGWKQGEGVVPFGVIAQDLHAVAPQAVHAGDDADEIERVWGVDYSKLVPMLIKEVQSLRARVAQLEGK